MVDKPLKEEALLESEVDESSKIQIKISNIMK